jgi:hypothetical protein
MMCRVWDVDSIMETFNIDLETLLENGTTLKYTRLWTNKGRSFDHMELEHMLMHIRCLRQLTIWLKKKTIENLPLFPVWESRTGKNKL